MKSNTTFIIATLLIAAGAYWYFFTGTGNEAPLTTSVTENVDQTKFRELIVKLPGSFDTKIFDDPRFSVLVDLTTQVAPETAGRIDPFATISGVSNTGRR
ncbi:MAG: hypothetical protein Q7J45_03900 [bacterium]|nr:hypothetical protein [bacterium]